MKKAFVGIGIVIFLLAAFLFDRPYIFGKSDGEGQYMTGSVAQTEEESDAASVVASAVNPTKAPVQTATTVPPTPAPTAKPAEMPTATQVPDITVIPDPIVTEKPEENSIVTDDDIKDVAELLEIPEDKVREVVERAEAEGYNLNPEEIMKGDFDILGAWGIVTDVFGKTEAAKLLLKVMKLGIF